MAVTITKFGPFYASGPILFSSLRTNFLATDIDGNVSADTSPISASQFRRITSQINTNPTVPNATENAQISTGTNLSLSQFRNSIKYYKASQTATDTNVNISTQAWNANLDKNIKKKFSINGTIGSSDINIPALLSSSGAHCNLEIAVTGKVLGAGGAGGIANGGNGGNGGTAMNIQNTFILPIKITIASGANIYGGGGGGGAGTVGGTGGNGGDGLVDGGTTTVYDDEGACNSFRNCYNICFGASGKQCTVFEAIISQNCNINYVNKGCTAIPNSNNHGVPRDVDNADTPTTGGIGGPGGNGGNGGAGAGYGGTDSEGSFGGAGTAGTAGGTNAGAGGNGGQGGRGGTGGTFGANGSPGNQGNTGNLGADGNVTGGSPGTAGGLPVGNGGIAGKAITGTGYILNPSPPPSGTIKGNI